jgi:nucleotide-binding universal stress UspA family protein
VNDLQETLLAFFTTHARGGLERAMLGSIAAACIRHAKLPMLVNWPKE